MRRTLSAGFTLVELTVMLAVMAAVIYAVNMTLLTGHRASEQTTTTMNITDGLRHSVRRISEELRGASRSAEDANGNGMLDSGEDTNGNGRLDADWQVSATSVTFNRAVADGTFSLPITYRLTGNVLERVATLDTSGKTGVTVVARSVKRFDVSEQLPKLEAEIEIEVTKSGRVMRQAETVVVLPRN